MSLRTTARGATVTIAFLAAAALAVSASPASAKISDGYVRGYDAFRGDWSDEGVLSTTENSVSNAVCLWQTILWVEGVKETDGTAFDRGDIDGHFGANTKRATQHLQAQPGWDLADSWGEADGRVGPNTFGEADDYLVKSGGFEDRDRTLFLTYNSGRATFDLYRNASGIYWFKIDDSYPWQAATYASGTTTCD
ncbi:peptidoglycan-binding protein [Streptomyces sp. N35]|uniref:peptidoglycan-binding domain-containing protein n=1 Tax=Streptomyces sp. N35 TaxID=2795730 RepID=UPI0018F39F83|nr:Tat pathway signal protein [Streptomyces sp. N35]